MSWVWHKTAFDCKALILELWRMWKYLFIAITPRSTLTGISINCRGPIYGSNRIVQSFTKDYYLFETIQLCANLLGYIEYLINTLGSVLGRVISKTSKMILDTSLLNSQQYKVRIKGKVDQSWERNSALPYTLV